MKGACFTLQKDGVQDIQSKPEIGASHNLMNLQEKQLLFDITFTFLKNKLF